MEVIAKSNVTSKHLSARIGSLSMMGAVAMMLSGCFGGGMGLFADSVDRSVLTATTGTAKTPEAISDEVTVSNAVTSADIGKLGGRPIPWANTSTGSAGVISTIREDRNDNGYCRMFRTTRHSYQGIANFDGKACMSGSGDWQLTSFAQAQ